MVYEKDLERREYIEGLRRVNNDHWYGKLRMFYSSFIMDLYTEEETVIGWADSDIVLTIPVTVDSIFKNGKLIVKGRNDFDKPFLVDWHWNESTFFALGKPMPTNFMSYFPTPVYARTLRNCRQHIMRRLNTTTFEEAFVKIMEFKRTISPVNIVFSYAFFFEKDLYDWHIDIYPEPTLASYNAKFLPSSYHLLESDLTPEIHLSVHTNYYKTTIKPIEQAICYSQIALGMKGIPHCDQFRNKINLQLFEFENTEKTHVKSWCEPGPKRENCRKLVNQRYKKWSDHYRKTGAHYNTSNLDVIQKVAKTTFGINCYNFTYAPYE